MSEPTRALAAPTSQVALDEAVHYNRFLVESLASWGRDAGRLLDFGAGNGCFAGALRERGFDVAAIEPDASLRERIRARGVPVGKSLEVLGEERFGGIYSIHVLEHIEDDVALLAAWRERLVPGGRLFVSVPAFPMLYSANDARRGRWRRYRRAGLVSALCTAGFRVVRVRHVDSIGLLVALWRKALGDRRGELDPAAVRLYDRVVFPISRALDAASSGLLGKNLLCEALRSESPATPLARGSG